MCAILEMAKAAVNEEQHQRATALALISIAEKLDTISLKIDDNVVATRDLVTITWAVNTHAPGENLGDLLSGNS